MSPSPDVPAPVYDQLADGGRLVVPVGDFGRNQVLRLISKRSGGDEVRDLTACAFVPLVGEYGWRPDDVADATTADDGEDGAGRA